MQRNKKHEESFKEFIRSLPNEAKILVVYFAVEDELVSKKHLTYKRYFEDLAGDKELELKIASKENFIEELRWADGVYFRGGDTNLLLDQVRKYPNFKEELLKKDLVFGSSAGVYFLSQFSLSSRRGVIYEGLGVLPIKVNCHYQEGKDISALDDYPGELLLLKEEEYQIIEI